MKKTSKEKLSFSKTAIIIFAARNTRRQQVEPWNTTTSTSTVSSNGTTVQPTISTGIFSND